MDVFRRLYPRARFGKTILVSEKKKRYDWVESVRDPVGMISRVLPYNSIRLTCAFEKHSDKCESLRRSVSVDDDFVVRMQSRATCVQHMPYSFIACLTQPSPRSSTIIENNSTHRERFA